MSKESLRCEWMMKWSIHRMSKPKQHVKKQYKRPKVTKIVSVSVHSTWNHEDNAKMGQGHHPWFWRMSFLFSFFFFLFFPVCYNLLNCFFKWINLPFFTNLRTIGNLSQNHNMWFYIWIVSLFYFSFES